MESPAIAPAEFLNAIERIESMLDNVVVTGDDDELFIASYLQGHFAVIARPLEVKENVSLAHLNEIMCKSLDEAFANNELEQDDQTRVFALWQQLLHEAGSEKP